MSRINPLDLGYGHLTEDQIRTLKAANRVDWPLTDTQKAAQWFLGGVFVGLFTCAVIMGVA